MKFLTKMARWGLVPWLMFLTVILFVWYVVIPTVQRWVKPANTMDLTPQQVAAKVAAVNAMWVPRIQTKDALFQLIAGYNVADLRLAMEHYSAQYGTGMYEDMAKWTYWVMPWSTDYKQAALANMQAAQ